MKIDNSIIRKRYHSPEIFVIEIDSDISLALQSEPLDPDEPGLYLQKSKQSLTDVFKFNIVL